MSRWGDEYYGSFMHTFDVNGIQYIHIVEYASGKITGSGILVGYAEE
jgi:hypothetical protein